MTIPTARLVSGSTTTTQFTRHERLDDRLSLSRGMADALSRRHMNEEMEGIFFLPSFNPF